MPPPASKLQEQMRARLAGGQFRHINELLYTQRGDESFRMMQEDPSMFTAYHSGFRSQTAGWPQNPLDVMIAEIRKSVAANGGSGNGPFTVADFGCGDARLAATLMGPPNGKAPSINSSGASSSSSTGGSGNGKSRFLVHSFDLVAPPGNAYVTACDMAKVPCASSSVDASVFCLSLMGTNYLDFLKEGARVLKPGGRLLIAEVRSRFGSGSADDASANANAQGGHKPGHNGNQQQQRSNKGQQQAGKKRQRDEMEAGGSSNGGGGSGVDAFVAAVKALGFNLEHRNESNTMFVKLFFRKKGGDSTASSALAGGKGATAMSSSSVAASAAPSPSSASYGVGEGERKKKKRNKNKNKSKGVDGAASPVGDNEEASHSAGNQQQSQPSAPPQKSWFPVKVPKQSGADAAAKDAAAVAPVLKACIYKKR